MSETPQIRIITSGWGPFRRWTVSDETSDKRFSDKELAINYAGMQLAGGDWSKVLIDGRPITPADSPAL